MTAPLGTPREEFLGSLRRSLGRVESSPPEHPFDRLGEGTAELEARVGELRQRLAETRPALLDQLAETAAVRGWQVYRNADPEQAQAYIGDLAARLEVSQVARSDQEVCRELSLDRVLADRGVAVTRVTRDEEHSREQLREVIARAGMGITGADYAVAETGSVVVLPRRGLSRLVSVVPPVHLALVRPEEVLSSLDDVFLLRLLEHRRNGGGLGRYLNFITGPSRTADIEQTLVVGVHGPREVHLVLLG